ncbi:MAG: hypothetical protein AAFS07_00665 [Pseudomonadota bacterium]
MKRWMTGVLLSFGVALGSAQAATLDFTDGLWEPSIVSFDDEVLQVRKEAAGVRFFIGGFIPEDVDFLFGFNTGVRYATDALFGAIILGIRPDTPIRITSISGISTSLVGEPPLELEVERTMLGPDDPFGTITFGAAETTIPVGPIELLDGQSLALNRSPQFGVNSTGFLRSIEFEVISPPPIPLPATLPMLVLAAAALGWAARHRAT